MRAITTFRRACALLIIPFFIGCASAPLPAQVQEGGYAGSSESYSRGELAQMLAPVALYPDALLSQILMASTYPIELVEAARWIRRNPTLPGDTLDAALLGKDWDPSVKAICHFPSILALMSERITETTNLGNAFLAQEADVMQVVQELRAKAHAEGNLTTISKQKVVVERETIIIQPADPTVIYLPYYNPYYVYGPWRYPAYPPYYWAPPGVSIRVGISYWPGIYFGFAYGSWSYFDWRRHYIHIDVYKRPKFVRHDRWIARSGRWHHAPRHRRGVAYRDKPTARKYGQSPQRARVFPRDIRGFPEYRGRDLRRQVRIPTESDKPRGERGRIAPIRPQRERFEREGKAPERAFGDKQKRQPTARATRDRQRVQRDRPEKTAGRSKGDQRERSAERRRDNVFNQVEDGKRERQSSKRGRASRQRLGDGARRTNRSDSAGRQGRNRKRR